MIFVDWTTLKTIEHCSYHKYSSLITVPEAIYVHCYTFVFTAAKKKFSFRECGWKPIDTRVWTADKQSLILAIDNLFRQILGGDFLPYVYDKDKGTCVDIQAMTALVEYDHDEWEKTYWSRMHPLLKIWLLENQQN